MDIQQPPFPKKIVSIVSKIHDPFAKTIARISSSGIHYALTHLVLGKDTGEYIHTIGMRNFVASILVSATSGIHTIKEIPGFTNIIFTKKLKEILSHEDLSLGEIQGLVETYVNLYIGNKTDTYDNILKNRRTKIFHREITKTLLQENNMIQLATKDQEFLQKFAQELSVKKPTFITKKDTTLGDLYTLHMRLQELRK